MRIRTVKPEFWSNEKMALLPDYARLLAIGLLNYSDDHGYFWANPLMVRGALFPFEEDSTKALRGLQHLAAEGYIRLGKTADGRECGHVVNFSLHQRVDKPQPSKIKPLASFQEQSENGLGTILDESSLYRIGKEGKGEGGAAGLQESSPNGSEQPEYKNREATRTLPPNLHTGLFREAWARWTEHWGEHFGRGRSIPQATADSHLIICAKLGSVAAVTAIETAISRGLREPSQPFNGPGTDKAPFEPTPASNVR